MRETAFSIRHTVIIAVIITTACAFIVVTVSSALKPRQLAWLAIDMNRSIVAAMGLSNETGDALSPAEIVERFGQLEVLLLDLTTGEQTNAFDPIVYNIFTATDNPDLQHKISPSADIAGLGRRATFAPAYHFFQGATLRRVGLPVYGPGMWSNIAAYVVLEGDYNTISNIYFHQHGETPGIGDQIESMQWREHWIGKKLRDDAGEFRLQQSKSTQTSEANAYQIDAISGATVTSSSVISIVQYWLGDDGYGPYLIKKREELSR